MPAPFPREKALQFFATSACESAEGNLNEVWKTISLQWLNLMKRCALSLFLGLQWFETSPEEGVPSPDLSEG